MDRTLQKDLLMAKIKVRRKKPLPWTVPDPRTNGFNPTGLQKFEEAYKAYTDASQMAMPNVPRKIAGATMKVSEYYEKLGEAIDSCPHELKQIMENEINPDNELVMTYFKKFISAVKLSEQVDFSRINAKKREVREDQERGEREFAEATENYDLRTKSIDAKRKSTEIEAKKIWNEICIALVQNVTTNPKLNSLGKWDRAMVQALKMLEPKACTVAKDGTITIDFAKLKKTHLADARDIFAEAAEQYKAFDEECYNAFLWEGPIEEVERYQWEIMTNKEKDQEVRAIMAVLAERRGMVLVKDVYGGVRYMHPDDLDDSIARGDEIWGGQDFFDPRDKFVLDIYQQARRRRKSI